MFHDFRVDRKPDELKNVKVKSVESGHKKFNNKLPKTMQDLGHLFSEELHINQNVQHVASFPCLHFMSSPLVGTNLGFQTGQALLLLEKPVRAPGGKSLRRLVDIRSVVFAAERVCWTPRLSPHPCLVDEGLDLLVGGLARLVGLEDHPEDVAELLTCPWHCCSPIGRRQVLLQLLQEVFHLERKGYDVAPGSIAVSCHMSFLVENGDAGFLFVFAFHGHEHHAG